MWCFQHSHIWRLHHKTSHILSSSLQKSSSSCGFFLYLFFWARHAFLDGLHSLSFLCRLLSPLPCSSLLSYTVKLVVFLSFYFFCLLPRGDCLDKERPWPFLSFSNPGTALHKLSSHFVYKVTNKKSNYPIG